MAQGDAGRASRYLLALYSGATTDEAEAGALLLADALVSLRALETTQVNWKGERPGL